MRSDGAPRLRAPLLSQSKSDRRRTVSQPLDVGVVGPVIVETQHARADVSRGMVVVWKGVDVAELQGRRRRHVVVDAATSDLVGDVQMPRQQPEW